MSKYNDHPEMGRERRRGRYEKRVQQNMANRALGSEDASGQAGEVRRGIELTATDRAALMSVNTKYSTDNWRQGAACAGIEFPDVFYDSEPKQAKLICDSCAVRALCLEEGLSERYGIWGGKTPSERGAIKRQRLNIRRKS